MQLALCIQTPEVPVPMPVALLCGTWEEKLARASALGVRGVELLTVHPDALPARDMRAALARHNLAVAAVGSGALAFVEGLALLSADAAVSAQAVSRLETLIAFAAQMGAPVVTIGSFRGRLAGRGEAGKQHLASLLRSAGDRAQALGVRLAVEPLNRYESDVINNAEQGLAFLEQVDHPAVGMLLDTYHVNIEESSWGEPFSRALLAGRLWHVHLGENNRLAPGWGLIDFRAIVATLQRHGYAGYLSAELLARPDPDAAAAQTVAYMRTLLEA